MSTYQRIIAIKLAHKKHEIYEAHAKIVCANCKIYVLKSPLDNASCTGAESSDKSNFPVFFVTVKCNISCKIVEFMNTIVIHFVTNKN